MKRWKGGGWRDIGKTKTKESYESGKRKKKDRKIEKRERREGQKERRERNSLYSPCVNPSISLVHTATNPRVSSSSSPKHLITISFTLCGCALLHTIVSNHAFVSS